MSKYQEIVDFALSRPDRQVFYAYFDEEVARRTRAEPGYYWVSLPTDQVLPVTKEHIDDDNRDVQAKGHARHEVYRARLDKHPSEWSVFDPFDVFKRSWLVWMGVGHVLWASLFFGFPLPISENWAWDTSEDPFYLIPSVAFYLIMWFQFFHTWHMKVNPVRASKVALGVMAFNAAWSARLAHEDARVAADRERYRQPAAQVQPRSFHERQQAQARSTYGVPPPPGGYIDRMGNPVDSEGWVLDALGRRFKRASESMRP